MHGPSSSRRMKLSREPRELFFIAAHHNFAVQLVHIPGQHNPLADALSRNRLSNYFSLAPQAHQEAAPIPLELAELSSALLSV